MHMECKILLIDSGVMPIWCLPVLSKYKACLPRMSPTGITNLLICFFKSMISKRPLIGESRKNST